MEKANAKPSTMANTSADTAIIDSNRPTYNV